MQNAIKGLADPVLDSQRAFRAILDAMSRPGSVAAIPQPSEVPAGLGSGAATLLLTLCDLETRVWMAHGRRQEIGRWLAFHTGSTIAAEPAEASFALIDGRAEEPPLALFPVGEDRYPDRSVTIIVECASLSGGKMVTLSGPGINGTCTVAPLGLRPGFWRECADNHSLFPLGVDVLFVAGDELMALPRSTAISEEGSPCTSR